MILLTDAQFYKNDLLYHKSMSFGACVLLGVKINFKIDVDPQF